MSDGARWVRFESSAEKPGAKTRVWWVMTLDGGALGRIAWFGRWRGYVFYPLAETVFERQCLRDIATFVEDETRKHMNARREARRGERDRATGTDAG